MRKFDTDVQKTKYTILVEVIKAFDAKKTYDQMLDEIPKKISPGPLSEFRCCIYKERAICQERIKLILNTSGNLKRIVQMINIACDECPVGGVFVSQFCRGCLGHMCVEACPKQAISIVDRKAIINKTKCIECGNCIKSCPYQAIVNHIRPCVKGCGVNAISMDQYKRAVIDDDKCIACGNCVYKCPFGACVDRSFIIDAIKLLNDKSHNVYALVAPAIASQFTYVDVEQLVTGIKQLGFYKVVEAAMGADAILQDEANEWIKNGILTSSCCPSFKFFIKHNFSEFAKYISNADSPMIKAAKLIKQKDEKAKVVFIGPCASKKTEFQMNKAQGFVDCVISFEEIQALFDARDIHLHGIKPTPLDDASYYGRIFAKTGGIIEGVKSLVQKSDTKNDFKPISLDGVEECRKIMNALKNNTNLPYNFFEGMICKGGCINGPLSLKRNPSMVSFIDNFSNRSKSKDPNKSASKFTS